MSVWHDFIDQRLNAIALWREFRAKSSGAIKTLNTQDGCYQHWLSNDYLGLSTQPELQIAASRASQIYGFGSTGAPSLSGYSVPQEQLAAALAAWLGFEQGLLFSSGYQLNVGLFSQLVDSNTTVWLDKTIHASHIDGVLLAKAKFVTFNAATLDDVFLKICEQSTRRHIVLSEGTFSMDGTCSYLTKLIQFKKAQPDNVLLIIDDAHGIGALGAQGLGTLEQVGIDYSAVDLLIGTLGKAFGTHGGFVVGSKRLITYLQQSVRSFLFSTCLPSSIAAASLASLAIIQSPIGQALRQKLLDNINAFQHFSNVYQLPIYHPLTNQSAIQLLVFADEQQVIALFNYLKHKHILVGRILYPTVPKMTPRIRLSLNATHHVDDIEVLCQHIHQWLHHDV